MPGKSRRSKLIAAPLTPFGRRVLYRWALLSKDGNLTAAKLAEKLGCGEVAALSLLKDHHPDWRSHAEYVGAMTRLCNMLRVDESWLTNAVDSGSWDKLKFDLTQRLTRGLDIPDRSLDAAKDGDSGTISP
jgi:hypothetical protein